ncbi:MAG TPA: BamA/TamA family outer membrane protein [Kofleriaceae bacterium]|nr:BamA/TamA family outer membrane protein [Kofleriaceae bacterium]
MSLLLAPATAAADPTVASSTKPPPHPDTGVEPNRGPAQHELTAADVRTAPLPGQEGGQLEPDPGDSTLRVIGRGILFVPKLAIELVLSPVRGAIWADDRYRLEDAYYRVFYNGDRTIGVFPTATYTSGFGFSAGAAFVDTQLFGAHESLTLQATTGAITGDTYRMGLLGSLRSGERFSHWLQLGIDAGFERRPAEPFFGIGNGDLVAPPGSPVDPQTNPTAVQTYHRYQEARVAVSGDARVLDSLHVLGTGALTQLRFASSTTGTPIDEVYAPEDLVGFTTGVRHAYGELEVRWDTRRRATEWEPHDVHALGSLAAAFAGRVHRLDGGADFWRYGVELQHNWRLARGPRVLTVRLRGTGVTGQRDEVPFIELPALGGGSFLRGYDYLRFRDRVAGFGTIQYQWDLSNLVDAYLFTDAGRVFPSLDELTVRGMRLGYGIGLELHGQNGFLLEGTLASSIDGGLLVSLALNPILDQKERWR